MTTRKGFKRLVRARMSKTGESYAAARRSLLGDTASAGRDGAARGLHPDTSTVATALALTGTVSPVTGLPLSEALVLVAGGGLGAGYILWEFKAADAAIVTLGFRNRWQYPAAWMATAIERLGIDHMVHETGGARAARATLDAILDRGLPAIVAIDVQAIGTWGQPVELFGYSGYPVLVTARTDGGYLVDDRGAEPFRVDAEVVAAARARIGSFKHRLVEIRRTPRPVAQDRLREALVTGLENQVDHLRSPSDSFSLPAWRKWSRLLTDTRNAKAWPRVFATGHGLFGVLLSVMEEVDGGVGANGGNLRELYAAGLRESATILDRPGLLEAASAWEASADLWADLADAAMPAELDGAAEAVEADEELHDAVMEGEPGRARANAAAGRVWAARRRYAREFPLPQDSIADLFADLGERLAAIHRTEHEAVEATARAVGR
jgi:Butirosin biosynthesis protein H, N-terminal/Domain of unknown function (DUF4872)